MPAIDEESQEDGREGGRQELANTHQVLLQARLLALRRRSIAGEDASVPNAGGAENAADVLSEELVAAIFADRHAVGSEVSRRLWDICDHTLYLTFIEVQAVYASEQCSVGRTGLRLLDLGMGGDAVARLVVAMAVDGSVAR